VDISAKRRSSVRRQLEAYEESWKQDPQAARACWDWEDTIVVGIALFRLLREREDSWRERVFRGVEEYAEDDNQSAQASFRDWLRTTEELLARLPALEKEFGMVERAQELCHCVDQARDLLAGWAPPRLSRAVGLREMTLAPQAAAELDKLLARAGNAATPPTRPLRRLPAAAPDFVEDLQKKPTP